jgi:hypothetical protein
MKRISLLNLAAVAGITLFMAACSGSIDNSSEEMALVEKNASLGTGICTTCNFDVALSDAEKNGFLWMREEEKVARDAYLTFYSLYKDVTFKNIAQSEQAHMDAILYLIKGYGLTDPAFSETGKFSPAFQAVYDGLIASGKTSLKAAVQAGIDIENMDIKDLKDHIAETSVANILQVYNNLLAGSNNHLSAFTTKLSRLK